MFRGKIRPYPYHYGYHNYTDKNIHIITPIKWWRGLDSNQRTLKEQIYSLSGLTTSLPLLWWRRLDSNQQPLPCKGSALPLSYAPSNYSTKDNKYFNSFLGDFDNPSNFSSSPSRASAIFTTISFLVTGSSPVLDK